MLEELQRDLLRLGQLRPLDRLAVRGRRRARAPRAPRSRLWLRFASGRRHALLTRMRSRMADMIDLQSHSTVSDGQLEPADVARSAAEAGVTVMSLTDHDGVAGVDGGEPGRGRARDRERPRDRDVLRPQVLRGPAHLRLLGRPREDPARLRPRPAGAGRPRQGDHRQAQRARRRRHASRTRSPRPAPPTRSAAPTSPRRPAPDPTSARSSRSTWSRARRRSSRASWPTAEQAVELIHEAGGVAVVAHPYWDVKDPDQVRDLVESLVRDVGLDGIETFYPPHTEEQTKHCLELCEEFGLVPTASSDFHGPTHKTFCQVGRLRHLRARRAAGAGKP